MGLMGMREGEAKIEIRWSSLLKGRIFEVTDGTPIVSGNTFSAGISHSTGGETFMLTGSQI